MDTEVEALPRINWPEKSGEYKVVQLQMDQQNYIRFDPEYGSTHGSILMGLASKLRRYDRLQMIDFSDSTGTYQIPAPESDWYKLVGAGKARIDLAKRRASFYGNSYNYGVGINSQHLDSMREFTPDWQIEEQ